MPHIDQKQTWGQRPGRLTGERVDGHLLPAFHVHMDLQKEFAEDPHKLSTLAHDLRTRLEAVQSSR
jgi:hypothetical protein